MKRKRLMKWVIENNLKHSEIAEKLGVSKPHWSAIINGKNNPSFALIERFKEVFQVENALELFEKEN